MMFPKLLQQSLSPLWSLASSVVDCHRPIIYPVVGLLQRHAIHFISIESMALHAWSATNTHKRDTTQSYYVAWYIRSHWCTIRNLPGLEASPLCMYCKYLFPAFWRTPPCHGRGCGDLIALQLDCPLLRVLDATFCGSLTDGAIASIVLPTVKTLNLAVYLHAH